MPKLSVIVPVYNTEKYLRECIDSILAQTFTDFELILVDDGSTDSSGAICDEYAGKDQRVQVIHQENGGVTRARKAAMRIAAGSWISFVDSDDWISSDMFEKMPEKAASGASEIIVCDALIEFPDKTEKAESLAADGVYEKAAMMDQIYPTMVMDRKSRRPGMAGWLCNKIFERNLVEKVFWSVDDSFVFSEDALCSYAAIFQCERMYVYRTPLYHYRQHTDSVMHQYNGTKRYRNLLKAYHAHAAMFKTYGPAYWQQLHDYVAISTMSNLRKILLYDTSVSLCKRLIQARDFVSQPIIADSLRETIKKLSDRKERLKMFLALHKCVGLLYFLFAAKQFRLDHAG